jgi:carboxyl-terminal processing protease
MKRRRLVTAGWGVLACLVFGGMLISQLPLHTAIAESDGYPELKVFTEVLTLVKKNYVEELLTKDLIYGAIRGMLKTIDPHSGFLPPEAYKEMKIDTKGEFGGLGIQIGIKESMLTVIAPIEDTPAWRAGIEAGDKIVSVEGESTKDMTLLEAVNKMRGPRGTQVTITIIRKGWKDTKDFTITRDIIKIKSVKYRVVDDGIGYIKISQFQERTARDLEKSLSSLEEENIDSLILDLRNNPGGLLNSAVDVSEQFLPEGRLVVYIKGRSGERTEYLTKGRRAHYDWPMVVLINQGSASASEIVAGAIKDWKRGLLVGIKTFGKGSVQSVVPLSDGSGLRLTTAKYYTPRGVSIQNMGIEPDIEVKLKTDNKETHPVLREKDLKNHLDNEQTPRDEKETKKEVAPVSVEEKDDAQLQRAIDLMKSWRIFREKPLESAGNVENNI